MFSTPLISKKYLVAIANISQFSEMTCCSVIFSPLSEWVQGCQSIHCVIEWLKFSVHHLAQSVIFRGNLDCQSFD